MKPIALLLACVLCGCASSLPQTNPSDRSPAQIQIMQPGLEMYSADITVTNNAASATVDGSPADLWPRLGQTLAGLGLEVDEANPNTRVIAVLDQRLPRINGKSGSTFFDCGSGSMAGTLANLYDVTFSLQAQLSPAEAGRTWIAMQTRGSARSRTASSAPVHCTSTGELEKYVVAGLAAKQP